MTPETHALTRTGRGLSPDELTRAIPDGGFFADKDWLLSPEPLALPPRIVSELHKLGHRLRLYQEACVRIYRASAKGKLPSFIAEYLDAGKPDWLIQHARAKGVCTQIPGVIRPDLILAENDGLAITELDGVPGGIGLTAWLNQTYESAGFEIVGSGTGMLDAFKGLFAKGADIVISEEAADYRPEMEWLAQSLGDGWRVADATSYHPRAGDDVYRFFELFDLENIPPARSLMRLAESRAVRLSPPFIPHFEEKLWAALFWSKPLQPVWEKELRRSQLLRLRELIPFSWVLDPLPVPHHAVIPRLELSSWGELKALSQKERRLVLKMSGFSDQAWGSRSVTVGHDVPASVWAAAVDAALESFPTNPFVLQEFKDAALVEHPYWDPQTSERRVMRGRVRLCPYYFTPVGATRPAPVLGGVLATIAPADKKLIHGMRDAILVPCTVRNDG